MRTRKPHGRAPKPLQVGLVALLIATLSLSALAVVFTNPAPITINDRTATTGAASPYPSNIVVSGMTGNTTKVNVTLTNFNHTFPDDVDILLVGPNPATQKYILMSDVGGSNSTNNLNLTFDDTGTALPDGGVLSSGLVRPTNIGATDTFPSPAPAGPYSNPPTAGSATLAGIFNGSSPNGTWSLYVGDDAAGDVGVIAGGWSVTITTDTTAATTFSNTNSIRINDSYGRATPYPSTIAVSGLTGTITDVNVTLTNMNHTFPQDIAVLLVGPKGQNLILMSQAVGDDLTPLSNTTITFDDQAATLLPTTGGVASGSFRPATYAIVDFPAPAPISPPNYPTLGGSSTLATAFNGTDPNGTWSLYVVDVAPPDPGSIAGGWSLDITAGGTVRRFTQSDFDGDGRSDVSTFNPTTHNWSIRDSSTFKYRTVIDWGMAGDRIVPGDYDGDGKTDIAVYRPSQGNWYIQQSGGAPLVRVVNWGLPTDIPVQGDYNNDGRTDFAVFRPSTGQWYILSAAGGTLPVIGWGSATDIPVPGDYDGDGISDTAVFRPSEKNWYIRKSSGGATVKNWGATGDYAVQADYDGDFKTDIAVWRPSEGSWYIIRSSDNTIQTRNWGNAGDTPVPADYDGDNKADLAVWRGSEGNWYIIQSAISGITPDHRLDNLGASNETPTPAGYLPQPNGSLRPEKEAARSTRK